MVYSATNISPKRFHRGQIKLYAVLIPIALFMLLPIIYICNHAFKPIEELFAYPPRFFVSQPTMENFRRLGSLAASSDIPLSRYVFNSVIVTVSVVVLTAVISTMGGYALSKMKFRGRVFLLEVNNIFLMFVPITVAIPRYLVVQFSGIANTYLAHILPLLAMPVGLFLVKQFIDQIPDSLLEAAAIDGASEWKAYCRIVLPLITPAVATACILAFQTVWGYVESSTLYVESEGMKTLAFFMNTLTSNSNIVAGQGMAAASALIMFIPNIALFILLQSRVMNTMAQSGIK